jgi:hypothetical protein
VDPDRSNFERLVGYTDGYAYLAVVAVFGGLLLLVLAPAMRKLMGSVH